MDLREMLSRFHGFETKLPDHYGNWLGYDIEKFAKNAPLIITRLEIREDHLSPSGAVHGGVISGFLDFSCGCAVFSALDKGVLCSSVELNVKYFKPLKKGDVLRAQAKVLHKGRSLTSVMATAYTDKGVDSPVALATGIFNSYQARV